MAKGSGKGETSCKDVCKYLNCSQLTENLINIIFRGSMYKHAFYECIRSINKYLLSVYDGIRNNPKNSKSHREKNSPDYKKLTAWSKWKKYV